MGLRVLAGMGAVPVVMAGTILMVVAETWTGRMCAVLVMSGGVLPWAGFTALAKRTRRWTLFVAGLMAPVVLLGALVLRAASVRSARPSERATSHYADTSNRPTWFSPARIIPEVDQLMFAFTVMPLIDPLLTASQAKELRRHTATIYREIAADEDFRNLPSAMGETYADLLGSSRSSAPVKMEFNSPGADASRGSRISEHTFLYVPAKLDRTNPAPVLVFFHGSGGNFQAYLWILAELADRLSCVLVAPSNGMGWWEGTASVEAFDRALTIAGNALTIDRSRIDAIGLSNGGLALSRLASARTEQLRSLIFLSSVLDEAAIQSTTFAHAWGGRPILFVTGETDDRVPWNYIERNVRRLHAAGVRAEMQTLPADHFLMFSNRQKLVASLENWLKSGAARVSVLVEQ